LNLHPFHDSFHELRASIEEVTAYRARLLTLAECLADTRPVLARSRVRCIVHDRLSPAIEDLESIVAELAGATVPAEPLQQAREAPALRQGEAEALLTDLWSVPAGERCRALREDSRFHSVDLLELLLERSEAAQERNPEEAIALAGLASALAGGLGHRETGDEEPALSLARAAIVCGNAWRLLGQRAEAEEALARAAHFLVFTDEPVESAWLCRALGLLRWEQGRLPEAEALLRQAGRSFAEVELAAEEAACDALLGLLALEGNRPGKAARLLQAGLEGLDSATRPGLLVYAGLGLALARADLGQTDRTRGLLEEMRRRGPLLAGEREGVRLSWWEGKVCVWLGDPAGAERLLADARHRFLAEASLPEAVLSTLDLAVVLMEEGRAAEVPALVSGLEAAFPAEPGLDAARQLFAGFTAEAARGKKIPRSYAAAAAPLLRRLLRFRGYRVEPLPFA
jgi:tetratricopeptide (TPR) repeat protein